MFSLKSKALSLLLTAALCLSCPATAFAVNSEEMVADSTVVSATEELIGVFDEETGMYRYAFDDDSEFWTSELLTVKGIVTSAFWIATEAADVEIIVTKNGEPVDMNEEPVLSETGSYVVEIAHIPADGERTVSVYDVEIKPSDEVVSGDAAASIVGRLEVTHDGEGYSYLFGEVGSVWTNVLDGETISEPAKLLIDDVLYCTVRRDGVTYPLSHNGVISDDGAYSVIITASHSDGSIETRYFAFNVYTNASNRLGIYHPPFGYAIESVLFEGSPYPFTKDYCRFEQDGGYSVTYGNGTDSLTVLLERDTTPPVLYFNGGSDIIFDDDVTVTADSPCTITVQRNGMPEGTDTTLTDSGIYRITAVDKAGNTTSARIEIVRPSTTEPLAVAVVTAGIVIAAVIYYIILKNKRPVVR